MRRCVLSLLGLAVLLRADFNAARWQFLRVMAVGQAQQVCTLTLDRTIYVGARTDLADLRLVRNGQEIPYADCVSSAMRQA